MAASRTYAQLDEDKSNRVDANERMRQHLAERSQSDHIILELEPDFNDELELNMFASSRHTRIIQGSLIIGAAAYLCYMATKVGDATIVPSSYLFTSDQLMWAVYPTCLVFGALHIWSRAWKDGYAFIIVVIFELANMMAFFFSFSLLWYTLLDVIKRSDSVKLTDETISPHTPELGWGSWVANEVSGVAASLAHLAIMYANGTVFRLNHSIVGRYTPWDTRNFVVPVAPFFDYYHRATRVILIINTILLAISIIWSAIQPVVLWQSFAVHIVTLLQWYIMIASARRHRDDYKAIDIVLPLMRFIGVCLTEVVLVAGRISEFGDGTGLIFGVIVYAGTHMMAIVAVFFLSRRFDPFVERFFDQRKRSEYARTLNLKDLPSSVSIMFGSEVPADSITQVISRDVHGFFTTDLFTANWKDRCWAVRLGRSHYLRKSAQLTKRDEDESKEVMSYLNAPAHRNVLQTHGICVDFAAAPNAARTFAFFMENLVIWPTLEDVIKRISHTSSSNGSGSGAIEQSSSSHRRDGSIQTIGPRDPTTPLQLRTWLEVGAIARDIAHGLSHLHSHGVLHRELVAKNVYLRSVALSQSTARWADKQRGDINNVIPAERSLGLQEVELADLSIDVADEPDWTAVLSDGMLARQLNHQLSTQQQQMRAMMSRVDAAAAAASSSSSSSSSSTSGDMEGKYHNVSGGGALSQLSWLPPECQLDAGFTTKSDVYLWASIVWDMIIVPDDRTLLLPATLNLTATISAAIQAGRTRVVIAAVHRLPLANLLTQCWSATVATRPTIDDVLRALRPLITTTSDDE